MPFRAPGINTGYIRLPDPNVNFSSAQELFSGISERVRGRAISKVLGETPIDTEDMEGSYNKLMGNLTASGATPTEALGLTTKAMEPIYKKNYYDVSQGNLELRQKEYDRNAVKWGQDAYGNPTGVNKDTNRIVQPQWGILTPEEITTAKAQGFENVAELDAANDTPATEVSEVIPEPTGEVGSVIPGYSATEAQPGSEAYAQQFMAAAEVNPIDVGGSGERTASLNTVKGSLPPAKDGGFDYANWNEKAGGYKTGSMEVPNATGVTMDPDTGKYYQYGVEATPPKDIGSRTIENDDGTKTIIPINKKTQRPLNPKHVPLLDEKKPNVSWKLETRYDDGVETKINIGTTKDGKMFTTDANGSVVPINDINKFLGAKQPKVNNELKGAEQASTDVLNTLTEFGNRVKGTPTAVGSVGSNPGSYAGNQFADEYKLDTEDQRTRQYIDRNTEVIAAQLRKAAGETGVMTDRDVDRYVKLIGNPDVPYAQYMETLNEVQNKIYDGLKLRADGQGVKLDMEPPVQFSTDSANNVSNPLTRQGREDIYNDVTSDVSGTAQGFGKAMYDALPVKGLAGPAYEYLLPDENKRTNATGELFGNVAAGFSGGKIAGSTAGKALGTNIVSSTLSKKVAKERLNLLRPKSNPNIKATVPAPAVPRPPGIAFLADLVGKVSPDAKAGIDNAWRTLISPVHQSSKDALTKILVDRISANAKKGVSRAAIQRQINKAIKDHTTTWGKVGKAVGNTTGTAIGTLLGANKDD